MRLLARLATMSVLLVMSSRPVSAGLTWSSTKVETAVKGGQESFETVFHFKNTGDKPVKVTSVQTSCGCTTATLAKTTYAPGEAGELKAEIDLRNRSGLQEKEVTVTTDDAPNAPVILALRVTIPEVLELSTRLLVWNHGSKPETKEITLTAGSDVAVTLRDVVYSPQFTVEQITDSPGRRYRLRITPRSTDSHYRDDILVQYEATVGEPREVLIYAVVQ
jgi:hypothetical protein